MAKATSHEGYVVTREASGRWSVYDQEGYRAAGPFLLRSQAAHVALCLTNDERIAAGKRPL